MAQDRDGVGYSVISPHFAQWLKVIGLALGAFTTAMAVAVSEESAEGAAITVLEVLNIITATYGALQAGLMGAPKDARSDFARTRHGDAGPHIP